MMFFMTWSSRWRRRYSLTPWGNGSLTIETRRRGRPMSVGRIPPFIPSGTTLVSFPISFDISIISSVESFSFSWSFSIMIISFMTFSIIAFLMSVPKTRWWR